MLCRIHSLEINQPNSGTKVLNQLPFPFAIQEDPSFVLNGHRLIEAQFAVGGLTPGPLLQNRDLQHCWPARLPIQ